MFKALLAVQWKWTRGAALVANLFAFAVPLASVQMTDQEARDATYIVMRMQGFGVGYAVLAGAIGLAYAVLAWAPDHKGRHVYALSLPIDRSKYAGMRFAAGLLFLVPPMLGLLAGSLIALAVAPVPAGLHGYPVALMLRFVLAGAVAFSIFFAVASSTPKAAGIVLGAIATLMVIAFILSAASVEYDLLGHVGDALFSEPGPLSLFTGRWMLIDA
jgi:hypothetical protein